MTPNPRTETDALPLIHCLLELNPDQVSFILQTSDSGSVKGLLELVAGHLFVTSPREKPPLRADELRRQITEKQRGALLRLCASTDPRRAKRLLKEDRESLACQALKTVLPPLLRAELATPP